MTNSTISYSVTAANAYIGINYVIAILNVLIVIVFFIGTVLSKNMPCILKTVHIQFLVSGLISSVYQFMYRKEARCRGIFAFEVFTTFPIVAQLTFMILCTYLIFKEQFETTRTKVYFVISLVCNWCPAFFCEASLDPEILKRNGFFCFMDKSSLNTAFWILTGVFQINFYVIIFLIHRQLKSLKETFTGDINLLSDLHRKICVQFGFGLFYSCMMWTFIFSKKYLPSACFYFFGVLYHLAIPVLCFVFIWSPSLKKSISRMPCFRWIDKQEDESIENDEIALV